MQKFRPVLFFALLCAGLPVCAQPPAIIPQPVSTQWLTGSFIIDPHVVLVADSSDNPSTNFFNAYLQEIYGFHLRVVGGDRQPASGYIRLYNHPDKDPGIVPGPEGRYTLKVSQESIIIRGDTHTGVGNISPGCGGRADRTLCWSCRRRDDTGTGCHQGCPGKNSYRSLSDYKAKGRRLPLLG